MAQMNGMEKRNFTNYARNGGKTAEMRNNSAKSGMSAKAADIEPGLLALFKSVTGVWFF